MSEWNVEVVKINGHRPHPDADTLFMTNIHGDGRTSEGGYPVIFKNDAFEDGQLVVYVPVDSVLPDLLEYEFIYSMLSRGEDGKVKSKHLDIDGKVKEKYRRVKAKKLRGIFSMGMMQPLPPLPEGKEKWEVGDIVHEVMGITKYEPPIEMLVGDCDKDTGVLPTYTDIDGFRKFSNLFKEGEEVVLTEKLHGTNSRYIYKDGELVVGSHHRIKKHPSDSIWSKIATIYDLEEKLSKHEGFAIYGEIFGQGIQNLHYGSKPSLRLFDVLDTTAGKFLDWEDFLAFCKDIDIEHVPVLHVGPLNKELLELRNGQSTLADHIREGFVIKPIHEQYSNNNRGRKILKFIGEDYQLNKKS